MNEKNIILTIEGDSYLIPKEQTTNLTELLERVGAWQKVKTKNYNAREWEIAWPSAPELKVAVVSAEQVSDGKPKDAAAEAF